jgi:glycogen synthase
MRILVCTTEYPPSFSSGIGNVAYSVVEQLKNHGVEFTICSPLNADIKLGNIRVIQYFGILGLLHYWFAVSKYFKKSDYDMVWLDNPLFLFKNPFKK